MRKKVAIYIDYALRIPNFKACYDQFKLELFSSNDLQDDIAKDEGEDDIRFYWKKQIAIPDVETFYMNKVVKDDAEDFFKLYFYNNEHYAKFMEDYSFNLYVDCVQPNKMDNEIINITQNSLFDVVLVDEYISNRKIGNTLFYLSKLGLYPHSVMFIKEGAELDGEYFGVWNPKTTAGHVNKKGDNVFLEWIKELEQKSKVNE